MLHPQRRRPALSAMLALLLAISTATAAAQLTDTYSAVQPQGLQSLFSSRKLQQDALSNSDGCITSGTIPKCEAGACVTRNILGTARWACLRCSGNYQPVVDSSGQSNIIQCVCPKGFYEASVNATTCTRCPKDTFCLGGDQVETPASRGTMTSCGTNLITRTDGARSQIDCVASAGYAMSSPNTATPCARSEYAPKFNRLARCLRCQSGLEEPLDSGFNATQRGRKRDVCKVPPGRYMSQGLVRWCAQGFYRATYQEYDAADAQLCLPCRPGITTPGAGAASASQCNRALPGYGVALVQNFTSAASLPPLPQNATDGGLPAASVCPIGYYSGNSNFCLQCPSGTVTRTPGAQTVEECQVPPGYVIANGALAQCGSSLYRPLWVLFSDPRAQACLPCGANIQSEPRDLDEHPLATNSSLVRASTASCFINAGQGMIAAGNNIFTASDCPANTYGAAGKVYGLVAAPCKPCPRNMITNGLTNVNTSDLCINPDGFGYASEGASRCAVGFYALKGSRKPCQRCPTFRSTADNTTLQRLNTDCLVLPGYGLVSSVGNSSDGTGFLSDTSIYTDAQAAVMTVLECPLGYWGAGNSLRATCNKCPAGSTTEAPGSTKLDDCSVCLPGYGEQPNVGSGCLPCAYGSYHPGGARQCTRCPIATFYPPVDGVGPQWPSSGTTLWTAATGEEACVPQESQLSPDAGQAYFGAAELRQLATPTQGVTTLAACIGTCPSAKTCMVQWDAAASVCHTVVLDWDGSGTVGIKLKYKLPPSTLSSASKLRGNSSAPVAKAKMLASGFYGRASIPAGNETAWRQSGVALDAERAQTFRWGTAGVWDFPRSEAECQRKCDDSVVCAWFLYDPATQACLYRGARDALRTRSFYVLPNITAAGATPAPAPTPQPTPTPPNFSSSLVPEDYARKYIFQEKVTYATAFVTKEPAACAATCQGACCLRQYAPSTGDCRVASLDAAAQQLNPEGNEKYAFVIKQPLDAAQQLKQPLPGPDGFDRGLPITQASCRLADSVAAGYFQLGVPLSADATTALAEGTAPEWDDAPAGKADTAICWERCQANPICLGFIVQRDKPACHYRGFKKVDDVWQSFLFGSSSPALLPAEAEAVIFPAGDPPPYVFSSSSNPGSSYTQRECQQQCPAGDDCCLRQLSSAPPGSETGACRTYSFGAAGEAQQAKTGTRARYEFRYKRVAGDPAASSVPVGGYGGAAAPDPPKCLLADKDAPAFQRLGVPLAADATSPADVGTAVWDEPDGGDLAVCWKKCAGSDTCLGFVVDNESKTTKSPVVCMYRGFPTAADSTWSSWLY